MGATARQIVNIPGVFAEAARKFAHKAWLVRKTASGWESRTFQEVREQARAFAAWLVRQNVGKNDTVALAAPAGPAWMTALLGVFLAGAVPAPLSARLLPAELRLRLEHCRPRFILVSPSLKETAAALAGGLSSPPGIVCLDEEEPRNDSFAAAPAGELWFSACCEAGRTDFPEEALARVQKTLREDDEALVYYTPGTDGPSKAVCLTHANFLGLTEEASRFFDFPRVFRAMLALPLDFSCIHTAGIPVTLLRGIPVFFSDEPETLRESRPLPLKMRYPNPVFFLSEPWVLEKLKKRILRDIERKGRLTRALFRLGIRTGEKYFGDGFNKTPLRTRLRSWLPYYLANHFVFSLLRRSFGCRLRFFVGGAGLSLKDQAFFRAIGVPAFQGYTLAETSFAVSANLLTAHKLGTSGLVLPGTSCRILNSGGYPSGIGETGEICVQGRLVMKGYYKNEEATQEVLRSDWLYSGDMGYVDEDGFLVVTGRKSNLLVSPNGDKFSPECVEEAILSSSPLFRQALVYNARGRYSVALVVLDEAFFTELAERTHLAGKGEVLTAVTDAFYAFTRDTFRPAAVPEAWRPATFRVLEEPFCEKNGTLNSARKMVRERIIRSSRQILDSMYAAGEDTPHCEANLEAVWRLTQKTLGVKV